MANQRLLKGVDIFVRVLTDYTNVDTLLIENGFLIWGDSESFRSNTRIWNSCFPAYGPNWIYI